MNLREEDLRELVVQHSARLRKIMPTRKEEKFLRILRERGPLTASGMGREVGERALTTSVTLGVMHRKHLVTRVNVGDSRTGIRYEYTILLTRASATG